MLKDSYELTDQFIRFITMNSYDSEVVFQEIATGRICFCQTSTVTRFVTSATSISSSVTALLQALFYKRCTLYFCTVLYRLRTVLHAFGGVQQRYK